MQDNNARPVTQYFQDIQMKMGIVPNMIDDCIISAEIADSAKSSEVPKGS